MCSYELQVPENDTIESLLAIRFLPAPYPIIYLHCSTITCRLFSKTQQPRWRQQDWSCYSDIPVDLTPICLTLWHCTSSFSQQDSATPQKLLRNNKEDLNMSVLFRWCNMILNNIRQEMKMDHREWGLLHLARPKYINSRQQPSLNSQILNFLPTVGSELAAQQ